MFHKNYYYLPILTSPNILSYSPMVSSLYILSTSGYFYIVYLTAIIVKTIVNSELRNNGYQIRGIGNPHNHSQTTISKIGNHIRNSSIGRY